MTTTTAAPSETPREIRQVDLKIAQTQEFEVYLSEAIKADPCRELLLIHTVVTDYLGDLQRVANDKKISEDDYYKLMRSQALAASLVEEMHTTDDTHLLADWHWGIESDKIEHVIANYLVSALQQFTESLTYGTRRRDFNPLTDSGLAGMVALTGYNAKKKSKKK